MLSLTKRTKIIFQKFRDLLITSIVALGLVAIANVGSHGARAETIILASGLAAPYLPYPMAVDGGFMKKHGVDAVYKIFPSGVEAVVAVGAGEAHVAHTACPTVLKTKAAGSNFLLVARNILNTKELKFVVSPDIKGPEDLRGRKIGLLKGTSVDWYASKYFKAFDLEEGTGQDEVTTLNIAAPEWVPAMHRGDIVGFFGWEPWLNKALEIVDGARILHRSADNKLHVLTNCMVFSTEWVRRDPETARRVMAALVEAHDGVSQNLEMAVRLSAKPMRIPEKVLTGMAAGFIYKIDFTAEFLTHIGNAAEWLESKALLKPGQGNRIIEDLVHPEVLRSVAPSRVHIGK